MATKGALDRERVARKIVAAARIHAPLVGARLQEVFSPAVAEGEPAPDFAVFLDQLARYLEMRIEEMVAKEKLHFAELDDDLAPQRRRDQAAEAVRDTLLALRSTINGAFGSDFGEKLLGVEGRTPDDPLALFRQAEEALDKLTAESLELPSLRLEGFSVDLGTLVAQLQSPLDELGRALVEVNDQSRLKEATIRERDLALGAFDVAVGSVGRIVIAFDNLAGFPEFGERIRFTVPFRRRRGTSPPEETPPAETLPAETLPADPGPAPPAGEPQPDPPSGLPEVPEIS